FNSKMTLEWAQYFAGRVLQTAGTAVNRQIEIAYRLAFGRRPDPQERQTSSTFLKQQQELITGRSPGDDEPPLPLGVPAENGDGAALVDFCHTLMNANEFVYLN